MILAYLSRNCSVSFWPFCSHPLGYGTGVTGTTSVPLFDRIAMHFAHWPNLSSK